MKRGLFLLMFVARAALADDAPAATRPPPAEARVRASHRVDVIAPGDRVETIIDRMRKERAVAPPAEAKAPDRPPVRAPDRGAVRAAPPDGRQGKDASKAGPSGGGGPPPERQRR